MECDQIRFIFQHSSLYCLHTFLYVCMYVYMYVCMYVCIFVCMYEFLKLRKSDILDKKELTFRKSKWRNTFRVCLFWRVPQWLKRLLRKGTKMDSQVQKPTWKSDVWDRVLLSKNGYINHMKSREKCEQDTHPLKLGYTTCVTCSKIYKFLSHTEIVNQLRLFKVRSSPQYIGLLDGYGLPFL